MFPYMCLATLPIFCSDSWPKNVISNAPSLAQKFCLPSPEKSLSGEVKKSNWKLFFMSAYVATQLALPWTHSITQVYPCLLLSSFNIISIPSKSRLSYF